MAIVINSLTPPFPPETNNTIVISSGQSVTFTVVAQETTSLPLTYEWQVSYDNGATYTSSGLFNNTSSTFQTSNLTSGQSGYYWRVAISNGVDTVYSNQVSAIGVRIVVVTAAPLIVVLDQYNPSYTSAVGGSLQLQATSSLLNVNVSSATNVNNIGVEWQRSTDNGSNWTTVSSGTDNQTIATTTILLEDGVSYARRSILTLSNISFAKNLYQYRIRFTYTGASNTPITLDASTIYVNPVISILFNPGTLPTDSTQVQSYSTAVANTGQARFQVSAFSTAGQPVFYSWQVNIGTSNWYDVDDVLSKYWFRLKPGTTSTSDILELDRLIYFENFGVRAVVTGSVGETSVTTSSYFIEMFDDQEPVVIPNTAVSSVEDRYGNIENRNTFSDPIRVVELTAEIDISRNLGLNGNVTIIFQRKNPGETTWSDIGESVSRILPTETSDYTPNPDTVPQDFLGISYTTPPLRRSVDHLAEYRVKVTSTSLYTLSGSNKVLVPYYSSVITLSVYRSAIITSQPTDSIIFNNQTASFGVNAIASSGTDITYQWQYNTSSSSSGWINVPESAPYSNTQTNLLIITAATTLITRRFYRCIVSVPDQLFSVTSSAAQLGFLTDSFTSISSLNDYYVKEYESVLWTVTAQSLSLGTVLYQWQKSTNYNPSSPGAATWTDIASANTNSLSFPSVLVSNDGFYRCKLTSFGGTIAYTNIARLEVQRVGINITLNTPSTRTFLEGAINEYVFEVSANSTIGVAPTYQWEIRRVGDTNFSNLPSGYLGSPSNANRYVPLPFDRITDNSAVIRCKISATGVPTDVYSAECTITVNRRFSYFADAAIKVVTSGNPFTLDLNPTFTGGTPSYQWQRSTDGGSSWSNLSGETASTLSISSITSTSNNYRYRCTITLTQCNQQEYSRSNTNFILPVTSPFNTVDVTLSVISAAFVPISYSKETQKTGAALGTVICVPKPPGYVNNTSATTDDNNQWAVANSGTADGGTGYSSSTNASSPPSWVSGTLKVPAWSQDRFPGYLEMRGQWLLKSEFPALYAIIGDTFSNPVSSTAFRMPNVYGKKLMGTGNVDNNSGSVSITPLFAANGTSGGDKNLVGSIGGVYTYDRSAQLPPGSPGVSGLPDGTAGVSNASTFTLGSFNTTGFTDCSAQTSTTFSGQYTYRVGPILAGFMSSPPPHGHGATVAGGIRLEAHAGGCRGGGLISPTFYGIREAGGNVLPGPANIPDDIAGSIHSHSVSLTPATAGDGASANHSTGIGSTSASDSVSQIVLLNQDNTNPVSLGITLSSVDITMTNQSRALFNGAMSFYLRNNESCPLLQPYFRLKYLIKAY
jgi:hypothetical protein